MSKKRKLNHLDSSLEEHSAAKPTHKRRRLNDHTTTTMQMKANNSNSSVLDANKSRRKKKMNKKMVIKQFKVQPKLSSTFESDTVDKLMSAVTDIYAKRSAECSFEELYRSCHSLCTLNKGKLIYDKLYARCDAHLQQMIASVSISVADPRRMDHSQVNLLPQLQSIWNNHRREMDAIRQVFLMLDRTYVRQETNVKSLWQMGIVLLKQHVLQRAQNAFIAENMLANLLRLIESERNGEEIDRELVKTMVMMIAHLGIYKSTFEKALVAASNAYYQSEGHKLIETLTVPDYLQHVMKRLEDEHARCVHYLDHKTQRHLSIAIEQQMMYTHAQRILDKGLVSMCDELLIADLRHLYALLKSVHKITPLKHAFYEYCKQRGLEIVNAGLQQAGGQEEQKQQQQQQQQQAKHDKEMIPKLLAFKKNLDTIISQSFQGHSDFRKIIRNSWENFINQRQNKPAELMAKFVDHQLQTGARGTSEQELEDTLARVMDIFRFVNGKDVFQAFYKKDLAKRLLLNTSASEDAEKSMINRIRKECGQSYASNLENMFKDIDISQDLNEKFRAHWKTTLGDKHVDDDHNVNGDGDSGGGDIEFNIHVLTSGCWPTYNTQPIVLPSSIQSRMSEFSKFYVRVNNGRKLNWTAPLSHCIMAANFPKGRKELVLSAFQACVLMLFNRCNKYKFIELYQATKIDKSELRKTMLSLVKANILLKKNKGMECADDEEFKLNAKYENRLRRVKVNQIQIVETKQELIKTSNKIYLDRQYQIDACVVRVMKARKELVHQQLMAECLKQLRFDAEPKQIKKRIEALIENDYLERDANNNTLYHYKA